MNRRLAILGGIGLAFLLLLSNSIFTVNEAQQALVLRFGAVARTVQTAGLHFKIPVIENVEFLEKRVLSFDLPPQELILGDSKRLVVDSFARYRITNPQLFYQRIRTEAALRGQLAPILNSGMRNVLGEVPLFTVLSEDRAELMGRILERANVSLADYGIDVVDIRIMRADLPEENSQAIYRRMQTEREREAKELRAQGAETAQRIRARAERERTVLIAEAQRDSQILRGEGDALAVTIFGEAFGKDPQFFDFYRSMQAYREALGSESTQFVMSPDNEFFRFFDGSALAVITTDLGVGVDPLTDGDASEETPDDSASLQAPTGDETESVDGQAAAEAAVLEGSAAATDDAAGSSNPPVDATTAVNEAVEAEQPAAAALSGDPVAVPQ